MMLPGPLINKIIIGPQLNNLVWLRGYWEPIILYHYN